MPGQPVPSLHSKSQSPERSPIFLNLDQKTQEWLIWRAQGIGASDAPIIMGVSPWSNIIALWRDKRATLESNNDDKEGGPNAQT